MPLWLRYKNYTILSANWPRFARLLSDTSVYAVNWFTSEAASVLLHCWSQSYVQPSTLQPQPKSTLWTLRQCADKVCHSREQWRGQKFLMGVRLNLLDKNIGTSGRPLSFTRISLRNHIPIILCIFLTLHATYMATRLQKNDTMSSATSAVDGRWMSPVAQEVTYVGATISVTEHYWGPSCVDSAGKCPLPDVHYCSMRICE